MKTLIGVVLDESGSMQLKVGDVIGGFNRFLEDQKKLTDPCRMLITKFNTICTTVMKPAPLAEAVALTSATYVPGGNTALLDAVANTVKLIDAAKEADERVLVLVITDGEENSSKETTRDQVKAIVKEREGRGDWTFTYLGPNPDAWHEMGLTGSFGNNAAYNAASPKKSFDKLSTATATLRASGVPSASAFYSGVKPTDDDQD